MDKLLKIKKKKANTFVFTDIYITQMNRNTIYIRKFQLIVSVYSAIDLI